MIDRYDSSKLNHELTNIIVPDYKVEASSNGKLNPDENCLISPLKNFTKQPSYPRFFEADSVIITFVILQVKLQQLYKCTAE